MPFTVYTSIVESGKARKYSPVFAQVRTNTDGEQYLEVIVYNERAFREEKYRRFIIHRGYVMEENEEKDGMQNIRIFKRKELIDVKEDMELNMVFEDLK